MDTGGVQIDKSENAPRFLLLFFADVAGELDHLDGGEGTFGAFVAKASAGAVCGLLMIVGGEDAEDDGNVAVAIEQRNALSDALAYVVEMWCAAAYDASEDNDNVVGAAFDEL